MTLLITEIHPTPSGDVVVFAADRRISRDGADAGARKKVFRIPGRKAGIGYFGLAEIETGASLQPMSEWVQDFFYSIDPSDDLAAIADRLATALNATVPRFYAESEVAGFHLAGLRPDGSAEFWFIRNIDDAGRLRLRRFEAREDLQGRDRPASPTGVSVIYRNGDTRAHVAAWRALDQSLGALLGTTDFRPVITTRDYEDWVTFKMETLAAFYEVFATESIIGRPVDCFVISPNDT